MKDVEFAVKLAHEAGKMMKHYFNTDLKKEWKADNSPVTEADKKINQFVIDEVRKKYPSYGVIGEEASFPQKSSLQWVCDPIDGTIPFSSGIPTCAFSLALVKNTQPIIGVAYDPFMDRLFIAEKGKGATMNNKKIAVSNARTIERGIVGLNGVKDVPIGDKFLSTTDLIKNIHEKKARIISLWSIVYQSMLVATGKIVGTIGRGGSVWDYAALKIIVEEAGGKVTSIQGKEQDYSKSVDGGIIANSYIHSELIQLINKSVK